MTPTHEDHERAVFWLANTDRGLLPALGDVVAAGFEPDTAARALLRWSRGQALDDAALELAVLEAVGMGDSLRACGLRVSLAAADLWRTLTTPWARFVVWLDTRHDRALADRLGAPWGIPTDPPLTDPPSIALDWLATPEGDTMPAHTTRHEPTAAAAQHRVTVDGEGLLTAADLVDLLVTVPADAAITVRTASQIGQLSYASMGPTGHDAPTHAWTVTAEWTDDLPSSVQAEVAEFDLAGCCQPWASGILGAWDDDAPEAAADDLNHDVVHAPPGRFGFLPCCGHHLKPDDQLAMSVYPDQVTCDRVPIPEGTQDDGLAEALSQLYVTDTNVTERVRQALSLSRADVPATAVNIICKARAVGRLPDSEADALRAVLTAAVSTTAPRPHHPACKLDADHIGGCHAARNRCGACRDLSAVHVPGCPEA